MLYRLLLAVLVAITTTTSVTVVLAGSIPVGFSTFFNTATCPDGWRQLGDTQGRLIVSTATASQSGITVNQPLANLQDVTHQHDYSAVVSVPHQGIGAVSCCDHQGAQHGNYPVVGTSQAATSGYPFTQMLLCTYDGKKGEGKSKGKEDIQESQQQKSSSSRVGGGGGSLSSLARRSKKVTQHNATTTGAKVGGGSLAYGTVGLFNPDVQSCPSGWAPMESAEGRVLLPGYEEGGAVPNQAASLASGEDRTHDHVYDIPIPLEGISFEGAGRCCNDNNGKLEVAKAAGTTAPSSSNIPYIQMLTCVNQEPSFNQTLPPGARTFSAVSCPPGYAVANDVSGRMLVSLPDGGSPGGSFGGNSIPPPGATGFAAVKHQHLINGTLSLPSSAIMLVEGCCDHGYAKAGDYVFAAQSSEGEVGLPFTMLPFCEFVGGQ